MATASAGVSSDDPMLISGAALSKAVTAALHEAGFGWVQGVALKRRSLRPNWEVVRLIGRAPQGTRAYFDAIKHPLIAEMQKKYVLT